MARSSTTTTTTRAERIAAVADTGAVGGPAGIRVRMYRVGFGDFFLLSLRKEDRVEHVLIDCGVHAKPTNSIADAIDQLKLDTGGRIALIVMTHRHADHISDFASGSEAFATFTVGKVWMPWFEDRGNPRAVRFQANLEAIATKLQQSFAVRNDPADSHFVSMAQNITGALDVRRYPRIRSRSTPSMAALPTRRPPSSI